MAYDFKLPDVGEGVDEAEVLKWMVEVGDGVLEDDPIAEVETERAIIEVPSPVDGKVERFHADEGDIVGVGERLVTFERGNGGEEARNDGGVEILDSDGNTAVEVDADGGERRPVEGNKEDGPPVSDATRRLAREMGIDPDEVEGSGEDGRVLAQDILHAAKEEQEERKEEREESEEETEDGDEGPGTAVPGKGDRTPEMEDEETAPEFGQRETPTVEPDTMEETSMFGDETPVSERTDDAGGVSDDAAVSGDDTPGTAKTDPFEEEVGERTEDDVKGPFEKEDTEKTSEESADPAVSGEDVGNGSSDVSAEFEEEKDTQEDTETTEPAEEKSERDRGAAPMTHHDVADAERFVEVCETIDGEAESGPTYSPLLVKACAEVLVENDVIGDGTDVNVGVAVETDNGVGVRVIKNVDEKGVAEISRLIDEADEVGNDEKEVTVTLVNPGATGGDGISPVVGTPGEAAVSVGEIRKRPFVVDGEVVARQTAPLRLTFDGRVADITDATRLTEDLKSVLKEPSLMLL